MKELTLLELLKSGAHFGHKKSRWNPKMKPYIHSVRNDIHIMDLEKTKKGLNKASKFITDVVGSGGKILFIGTKRQARSLVKTHAESCDMPYVNVRWLGGTFTNFKTIQKTIRKLEKLYKTQEGENFEAKFTKKERLMIEREIEKLERLFEGIKTLKQLPQAIFVVDVNNESIAIAEAKKSGVPVIAMVDSNSSPENVDYVIPVNDDATKAIDLVLQAMVHAVSKGQTAKASTDPQPSNPPAKVPAK